MRDATLLATLVAVAAGYLLGSVPIAVLVGRRHRVDPREVGDRNPGYWNVKESVGARQALPVFVGDVAKGILAGLVGVAVAPEGAWGVGYVAVGAAMVGHAWPVFARFRGGRSILTFVGGMCVLTPVAAAIAVVVFVAVSVVVSFAWGARAGIFVLPVLQVVVDSPYRTAATGALMTLIGLRFLTASRSGRSSGPATSSPA
jgi:acyl phosphate:glycerol-3-phosphate acyltransferase